MTAMEEFAHKLPWKIGFRRTGLSSQARMGGALGGNPKGHRNLRRRGG